MNAQDQALVRYAKLLTSSPKSVANADIVALRTAGFDDESILLAAEIIAYFNFVNRLAQGLGTHLELP